MILLCAKLCIGLCNCDLKHLSGFSHDYQNDELNSIHIKITSFI